MEIAVTIIPIFLVIMLGWGTRNMGFLPDTFIGPANTLVFYLAIPAMIFRSVSSAALKTQFNPKVVLGTLGALVICCAVCWLCIRFFSLPYRRRGTFIQCSLHGNLGYIGLAVAYYYLGNDGLAHAGIIVGFLMILQNFISVFSLQAYTPAASETKRGFMFASKILGNPVIASACCGIIVSLLDMKIPLLIDRTLHILAQMALPTALIIIGGSIAIRQIKTFMIPVMVSSAFKLILLPLCGLVIYRILGLSADIYLPGLILLASPTATIAAVMAREMSGDEMFAVAAISFSTLLSMLTFVVWLGISR